MKKLAVVVTTGALILSILIYFARGREYRRYKLEAKSDLVYPYKININLANSKEFENLPGIGPSLAQAIVDYRVANKRFENIDDLKEIKGISSKKYKSIESYLTLEVY